MSLRTCGMSQHLPQHSHPRGLQDPSARSFWDCSKLEWGGKITLIQCSLKKAKQEAKPAVRWCSWGWKSLEITMGSNSLLCNQKMGGEKMGEGGYFRLGVPPLPGAEREAALRAQGPPAQRKIKSMPWFIPIPWWFPLPECLHLLLKRFLPFFAG